MAEVFPQPLQLFDQMLEARRELSIRKIRGKYIATAVPLEFLGGPVPDDWRAESETLTTALGELLGTWSQTPSDFNWPEMIEEHERNK